MTEENDVVESAVHWTEQERQARGEYSGYSFTLQCYPHYEDDSVKWRVKALITDGSSGIEDFDSKQEAYEVFERLREKYGFTEVR